MIVYINNYIIVLTVFQLYLIIVDDLLFRIYNIILSFFTEVFLLKLTKPQQLIYDIEKIIGGPVAVMCGIMTVDKVCPEADVVAAIKKIYETNDALNYQIDDSGEEPRMYYKSPEGREVKVIRVNSLSELDKIGNEAASTPFDLNGWLSDLTAVIYPDGYGMVIKVHHLLGDAWSMSLCCTQLNAIIDGAPWRRYSYENYINAEKDYLESKRYARDRQFFIDAFKNCTEAVMLSDKFSTDYRVEKLYRSLSPQICSDLHDYAEKTDNSEFACLLGAFSVFYGKLKNCAESFFVGMPVLNRTSEKDMNTVGLFVNTVPVPICLDYEESFAENLQQIQNSVFSVFKHQRFNYNDIMNAVGEEFGFHGKLYDCIFNYQPDEILSGQAMNSTDYSHVLQSENLHLFIHNRNREKDFTMEYDYRSSVFTEEEIEHFHSMFMRTLNLLLTDDKRALKDISLIDEEEERLLESFNDTAVYYDKTKNVYDLFEEQVEKTPDKTALIAADCTLSYAQLKYESARFAKGLAEQGVEKGDIVAFCLPRDSRIFISMLGIIQLGAAYLPLDPSQPKKRIDYILKDSKAKLCVTDINYKNIISDETLKESINVMPESICYCIYTSGSTGMPKGTLLTHQNVMNYIGSGEKHICRIIGEEWNTILSVTSVGFDIFVTESLLPLANGKCVVLADDNQSRFGNYLQRVLHKYQVDAVQTTPSKMQLFLQSMSDKNCLKELKSILLGGEVLNKPLAEQLTKLTGAKIYNVYGPAETTVWVTYSAVESADDITIGKPIANTQIYIVDKYMKLVPIGVTGELCIAGDNVGQGYLNRPELTAEKFIDNPFGEGKLYKTGDLAHWREDGNIVFVGRNDFQIKLNGQRVELGEIEAALMSTEEIENAAVIVKQNDDRQFLCAFYTGKETETTELRGVIGKTLPRYMVPQAFTHLDIMPLNASGKTDRKALEQKEINFISEEYQAPQTEEEKLLVSTAMQVLNAEQIGMHDNFFDLGGDSLKSIAWISLLEQRGYTLSANEIFSCSDMAELKEKLRKTEANEIKEIDYPVELPLTSSQREIFVAQSVATDTPLYNIPYIIRVKSLDSAKLQYAVDRMLERHEILRTRFEKINGEIVQIIDENARCIVEKIEGKITDFIRPFNLSKAPLIRVGYQGNTIIFDLHHIIADGSSMSVFFRELNEYYMGREPQENFIPYKYFAVTEKESNVDIEYWNKQFADEVPSLNLRTDKPRPAIKTYEGRTLYSQFEKSEDEKVMQFCREHSITPFVFYCGAFQILMQKLSSQEDIVIATPVSSRTANNLDTIGMFVHTLPLRCKPEGNKTVGEFFREVRELSLEAANHTAAAPSKIAHRMGKTSLFDIMFTYQTEQMTALTFADAPAEIEKTPLSAAKYDFDFTVYPMKDGNVISATYNTSLFNEKTIEKMMKLYETILSKALIADEKLCDISIIDEEEEKLLESFNNTAVSYDKTKSVYDLFEEQAGNNTKAYIEDNQRKYTLKELDEAAAKIDAYIRKTVGSKKQVVGVICERSFDELAAIFGIVRGGNAYMPISPDYPKERIETMLEISGCTLVIAQKKYCDLTDKAIAIEDIPSEYTVFEPAAKAEDTLYVIYTSGSTGTPKGAMVSNRSAINRIGWMAEKYFNSSSVVMLKTPYTFDVSVWEIFGFAMYGFSLYILPPDLHYSQKEVLSHIGKGKVTDLHFVPTVFEQFLSVLKQTDNTEDKLNSLKNVILSGESLPAKAVNEFVRYHNGRIKVHNLYGPAECAIDVTSYECANEETDPIPIGKPIANTQIYIVDKYMKPVPIGVTGELCIAGDNVGQGYLNKPELTAEKFIDNPFGEGKLYKTGDLAHWRNDGNIVFVGRNDFQVKINGQRVELGEIEASLTAVEGIESAAVIVKSDGGSQFLCAFYTGKEIAASKLRSLLGKTLPRYMVPQAFTHLDIMPLNASGKTDRRALKKLEIRIETEVFEAPQTPIEAEICKNFCETLGVERFGRNDNFYDFGGTSLQIVHLLSRPPLDNLSVSDFMAEATPAALAKRLDETAKSEYNYLAEFYKPANAEKAVILFPFAGGDAAAYTALVAKAREEKSEIALFFVDWFDESQIDEIADEIRSLAKKMRLCFYSHCAGSVLAMELLDRLNAKTPLIQDYIAGASIPPGRLLSRINIWNYVSDNVIMKALKRSGLQTEVENNGKLPVDFSRFRRDTHIWNNYFRYKKTKTNVCVTAVISKKDPFTKNYADAKALWQKAVKEVNEVLLIDTPSHYFQNTDTKVLFDIFEKI